jgi:hypothetical protein
MAMSLRRLSTIVESLKTAQTQFNPGDVSHSFAKIEPWIFTAHKVNTISISGSLGLEVILKKNNH